MSCVENIVFSVFQNCSVKIFGGVIYFVKHTHTHTHAHLKSSRPALSLKRHKGTNIFRIFFNTNIIFVHRILQNLQNAKIIPHYPKMVLRHDFHPCQGLQLLTGYLCLYHILVNSFL
jgi:hypothetical protein